MICHFLASSRTILTSRSYCRLWGSDSSRMHVRSSSRLAAWHTTRVCGCGGRPQRRLQLVHGLHHGRSLELPLSLSDLQGSDELATIATFDLAWRLVSREVTRKAPYSVCVRVLCKYMEACRWNSRWNKGTSRKVLPCAPTHALQSITELPTGGASGRTSPSATSRHATSTCRGKTSLAIQTLHPPSVAVASRDTCSDGLTVVA